MTDTDTAPPATMLVRLPAELRAALNDLARRDNRSANHLAVHAITRYVQSRQPKRRPDRSGEHA